MDKVLLNLVGNAVRYAESREVVLTLDRSDRAEIRIHVRDTGPEIASEHRERIFEPFVQPDPIDAPRGEGTGLGPAISGRLARLVSGEVTVVSELGEGSTLTLRFPANGERTTKVGIATGG